MPIQINTITLPLPLRMGRVNCYLLRAETGFVLVDTGVRSNRVQLEDALVAAECTADNLNCIILTHGDFDHAGNAASLRRKYGVDVLMHAGDAGMVQQGDMFAGRRRPNVVVRSVARLLSLIRLVECFEPDGYLAEGDDLTAYGLKEAEVLHLPGHSRGSIGLLTKEGSLIVGDLLENTKQPGLNALMDDLAAGQTSLQRLRTMSIDWVYPGHGKPFRLGQLSG